MASGHKFWYPGVAGQPPERLRREPAKATKRESLKCDSFAHSSP
jgi:hypothetical protein